MGGTQCSWEENVNEGHSHVQPVQNRLGQWQACVLQVSMKKSTGVLHK